MLFNDIAGNSGVKNNLVQQVKNQRVSHAQLFFGPEGSGCLPMAIAFAQYLSCNNKGEHDSCGVCPSCLKFEKLAHPDFHIIFPVNTTASVKKDPVSDDFMAEWRNNVLENPFLSLYDWLRSLGIENKQGNISTEEGASLIRKLSLTAYEGAYKMVLIWMAESMNNSTANKLLKILEEPPEKTIFLLVAETPDLLLGTIRSRTHAIRFSPINDNEIITYLLRETNLDENMARQITTVSEGNLNLALKLSVQEELLKRDVDVFLDWMRICFRINMPKILGWVDRMAEQGRENQKNFLIHTIKLLRQTLMMNLQLPDLVKLHPVHKDSLQKFSPFIHQYNIDDLLETFNQAHYSLERNANAKILFLNLSFRISTLLNRKAETPKVA